MTFELHPEKTAANRLVMHLKGRLDAMTYLDFDQAAQPLLEALARGSTVVLDLAGPGFVRRRVRTPLVFVGNGVFANEGFGTPARTDLADGVLGVSIARVVSRWGLVRVVVGTLLRGGRTTADLDEVELTSLTVGLRARRVRVAIDGEILELQTPLRYRVRPSALHVLVPHPPEGVPPSTGDEPVEARQP